MTRRILLMFALLWLFPQLVGAQTLLYVSPSGSGTLCTNNSPCALNTGINNAFAGDHVVLKDGTYVQNKILTVRAGTSGNPITIRAANRRQAIFRSNGGLTTECVDIRHSYITLRGIVVDGAGGTQCFGGIRAFGLKGPPQVFVTGVIVEDNALIDLGGRAIGFFAVDGAIARWNYTNGTGKGIKDAGSGFYLGSFDGSSSAQNLEIYANIVLNTADEGVDIKVASNNIDIHHNIFDLIGSTPPLPEDGTPVTGVVTFSGAANHAHNNIMTTYTTYQFGGCATLDANGDNRFNNNVCSNGLSPSIAIGAFNTPSPFSNEIDFNTFCDLSSYVIRGDAQSANIHDNNGLPGSGAATSECDAEIARILLEQAALPGNPAPTPKFALDDTVEVVVVGAVNVRSAPSGTVLGTQPNESQGVIIGGPEMAPLPYSPFTPTVWWDVDFTSGVDGWVAEGFLILVPPPPQSGAGTFSGITKQSSR